MACKFFDILIKSPIGEDLDEFERGSDLKKVFVCTIIPDDLREFEPGNILNFCNEYEGYKQCGKDKQ